MFQKDKYAICTANRKYADYMIDNYVKSHNCKISNRIKSINESFAVMKDGTEYRWINPHYVSKQKRYSVAIIDLATCNIDFIKTIVRCICSFKSLENQYVFTDSENISNNKPYDLHTLIDRLTKIEMILGNIDNLNFYDLEYGLLRLTCLEVNKDKITFYAD